MLTVRKFVISIDATEAIDFPEQLDWFATRLLQLGFELNQTYQYRYADPECMMKVELVASQDGYFVYLYVQAADEHAYRAKSVADTFEAHAVDAAGTKRISLGNA